ncbi:Translation initiation factor SUI1 [uncultured virus]|nr:Translation initiation factor SUI1 [uncultured virus]
MSDSLNPATKSSLAGFKADSSNPVNPFGDFDDIHDLGTKITNNKIHIRLHQRNSRKTITSVEGLDEKFDLKRISSTLRKKFNCRGSSTTDPDTELTILEFSGDQRNKIRSFLITESIAEAGDITVHGY